MMRKNKFDLLESFNILFSLAKSGSYTLPNEACRFLANELNLTSVFFAEETKTNLFRSVASEGKQEYILNSDQSIEDYERLLESAEFEEKSIIECSVKNDPLGQQSLSHLLFFKDDKRLLISCYFKHIPTEEERKNTFQSIELIINLLQIWSKSNITTQVNLDFNSIEFLEKSNKGQVKDLKAINGILTLLKEEELSNGIEKYIEEIKTINNLLLAGSNDLYQIIHLDKNIISQSETEVELGEFLPKVVDRLTTTHSEFSVDVKNEVESSLITKIEVLTNILSESLEIVGALSKTNKIKLTTKLGVSGNLQIKISTITTHFPQEKLSLLSEPFEVRDLTSEISGYAVTLMTKRVNLLGGSLNITQDGDELTTNISIPVKHFDENTNTEEPKIVSEKTDKILVIESDAAATSLLKNYLKKWNYGTEIVNSGDKALALLNEHKYVSVILNIEQENENSLEILQKIKNNKFTRNTPVIVFSVEPETEKIYLMGSVDYLVKPINYNKLVEILTSYKLRRSSTVLCVDDDQPTLKLVKQAVQTAGFNVIAEHRSDLVIDLIRDKELDLAIIDLDMPKLNGFDLIKQIKNLEKFAKLPIIIYTGKEDYQEDLQKIDGMFVDLLDKKSTSFNELEGAITAMIKSYEEPSVVQNDKNNSTGPKILMAEDYKHSQIIVTRLLKKSGFENIIVVENGEEALNICENEKIDLVLMDMQMPVMNGFEATGKIRELQGYADTPIIALTAFAMKGDREKCLEAGATDYIPKPIDSKEFIEKVKYYTQVSATV